MQTLFASLNIQHTQHLQDKRIRMIKISWFKTLLEKRRLRNHQLYTSHYEVADLSSYQARKQALGDTP